MTRGIIGIFLLLLFLPTPAPADESGADSAPRSVGDGVYTEAQAQRGEVIYTSVCGRCHGYQLNGAPDDPDMLPAPPIAGPKFMRRWSGASLASLYAVIRATMPAINPGSLSDSEFADVLSYMLAVGGAPAGTDELGSEPGAMTRVVIE